MGNCMPSKWFKTTNSKTPQLKLFRFFQTISDKNYGINCFLDRFLLFHLFPSLTLLRLNKPNVRKAMLWFCNTLKEERVLGLNTVCRILIIFCCWLSETYNKKERWGTPQLISALMRLIMPGFYYYYYYHYYYYYYYYCFYFDRYYFYYHWVNTVKLYRKILSKSSQNQ